MITNRQKQILKWIVEEHVRTAEPVGSKAISELLDEGYSSATIRNDMATLEDEGLIIKTHTSSGRIPSETGYKLYISEVMSNRSPGEFPMIDEIFRRHDTSKEEAIRETMALVADLTNYASVVLGTGAYNARIKKLQIVKLSIQSAVIIMVTDQGYVESKKILIPEDINFKDIDRVVSLLNEALYDCPIAEIDNRLHNYMKEDDILANVEYYDELVSVFVRAMCDMAKDKYFMSGQTNILNQPEFQDIDKVRSILKAMEKQEILKVINLNNEGISVKIGQENEIKAMENCTVITVPYNDQAGQRGAIAIIGPTRMEYQKVIPLLNYIAKYLSKY